MPVEHVIEGWCALSNEDSILNSINDDPDKCVHDTPAADVICDSRLAHENEAPGELGSISPNSTPDMKTSALPTALYATHVGTTHPSAGIAKNSARPRPCHLVLVRREVMPKLLRQIEGGKVLLVML